MPIKISKTLDPKTFEAASSTSPFFALTTEITVSGTDVAAAVIVKAIIIGDIPKISAKLIELSVRKKVAIPIINKVTRAIPISFQIFVSLILFL